MKFFTLLNVLHVHLLATQVLAVTKIILPLYTNPTNVEWSNLESSLAQYPGLTFIIIINPASGPGTTPPNSQWVNGVSALKSHGNAIVIGYVHTSYDARATSAVEADISAYASWPANCRVSGIFFDETSVNDVSYYSTVASFARSTFSNSFLVLNPGTLPATNDYFSIADEILIHETTYSDYIGGDNAVPSGVSPSQLSVIVHTMPRNNADLSSLVAKLVSAGYGSIYLTDDPATYMKLGTDWGNFLSLMNAAINGGGITSTTSTSSSITTQKTTTTKTKTTTSKTKTTTTTRRHG